jgi:hypothetical protein
MRELDNENMDNIYIEFSFQGLDAGMFFLDFIQKYGRYNSVFFPIFVLGFGIPPINYLVLEANEDPLQEPREIAKMSFMKLDSESKVVIEFIGDDRNRWYTVEKLVKSLLEDLWNKDYRINSVFPRGLLHPSKVGNTKKELLGNHIEGELITEEIYSTNGLSTTSSNIKIYLPKDKVLKKKWKKAYSAMKRLKSTYQKDFDELKIDNPIPSNDDYRDALIDILGKKVSAKYIQRIQKAGKAGLLK